MASKHGNSETVQILLDAGANKNTVDKVGTEVVKNAWGAIGEEGGGFLITAGG